MAWRAQEWIPQPFAAENWNPLAWGTEESSSESFIVDTSIVPGFAGNSLDAYWFAFNEGLLDSGPTVASGILSLALAVGDSGGSHWYNDRLGVLDPHQLVYGDFDIVCELQVTNLAGDDLPPADGNARLAGLAAHDPFRPTGHRNYVHRMFGRAPGMEVLTDSIVEEDKSNVESVSDWHTRTHPSVEDCRGFIRIRRRGSRFTSWVSADGLTWINEVIWNRPDLPEALQIGISIYSAAVDADVAAQVFQVYNFRDGPVMSNTTAVQTDILEWAFEGTNMPAAPAARWLGYSTTTPTIAGANFTEPSDSEYGRVEITASMGAIQAGSGVRTIANDVEILFAAAGESQGDVTWIGVFSAETGGTPYRIAQLDDPQTIGVGDQLRLAVGQATFTQG